MYIYICIYIYIYIASECNEKSIEIPNSLATSQLLPPKTQELHCQRQLQNRSRHLPQHHTAEASQGDAGRGTGVGVHDDLSVAENIWRRKEGLFFGSKIEKSWKQFRVSCWKMIYTCWVTVWYGEFVHQKKWGGPSH